VSGNPKAVDQMAIDEKYLEDGELESALDEWDRAKLDQSVAAARVKNERANVDRLAERLELPAGVVARVGRWRLERITTEARSVSFTTAPKERVKISPAE